MRQALNSEELYQLLRRRHPANGHWPADTPWEMILGAFLVQNTTWTNTEKSLAQLRQATAFDPGAVSRLPRETLITLIHASGFHQNKSQLIHHFFRWLAQYDFDLAAIKQEMGSVAALRAELLGFRGIGPETADVLLLYAFDEPAFIADRYAAEIVPDLRVSGCR